MIITTPLHSRSQPAPDEPAGRPGSRQHQLTTSTANNAAVAAPKPEARHWTLARLCKTPPPDTSPTSAVELHQHTSQQQHTHDPAPGWRALAGAGLSTGRAIHNIRSPCSVHLLAQFLCASLSFLSTCWWPAARLRMRSISSSWAGSPSRRTWHLSVTQISTAAS